MINFSTNISSFQQYLSKLFILISINYNNSSSYISKYIASKRNEHLFALWWIYSDSPPQHWPWKINSYLCIPVLATIQFFTYPFPLFTISSVKHLEFCNPLVQVLPSLKYQPCPYSLIQSRYLNPFFFVLSLSLPTIVLKSISVKLVVMMTSIKITRIGHRTACGNCVNLNGFKFSLTHSTIIVKFLFLG